ncbi:hypothetical protein F5141DRAFT_1008027, partial [Pisolithus sp. B1]
NHGSALQHQLIVEAYIISEQAAGCYSQGFSPSQLKGIIGPFCTSPLNVIPKLNSTKF